MSRTPPPPALPPPAPPPAVPPSAVPPPPLPPALPPRLADPAPVALVGTALWFLASIGLLVARLTAGRPLDELFWTTVAGWLIGLLGYALFRWQRSAARRGSRSAQRGLGPL